MAWKKYELKSRFSLIILLFYHIVVPTTNCESYHLKEVHRRSYSEDNFKLTGGVCQREQGATDKICNDRQAVSDFHGYLCSCKCRRNMRTYSNRYGTCLSQNSDGSLFTTGNTLASYDYVRTYRIEDLIDKGFLVYICQNDGKTCVSNQLDNCTINKLDSHFDSHQKEDLFTSDRENDFFVRKIQNNVVFQAAKKVEKTFYQGKLLNISLECQHNESITSIKSFLLVKIFGTFTLPAKPTNNLTTVVLPTLRELTTSITVRSSGITTSSIIISTSLETRPLILTPSLPYGTTIPSFFNNTLLSRTIHVTKASTDPSNINPPESINIVLNSSHQRTIALITSNAPYRTETNGFSEPTKRFFTNGRSDAPTISVKSGDFIISSSIFQDKTDGILQETSSLDITGALSSSTISPNSPSVQAAKTSDGNNTFNFSIFAGAFIGGCMLTFFLIFGLLVLKKKRKRLQRNKDMQSVYEIPPERSPQIFRRNNGVDAPYNMLSVRYVEETPSYQDLKRRTQVQEDHFYEKPVIQSSISTSPVRDQINLGFCDDEKVDIPADNNSEKYIRPIEIGAGNIKKRHTGLRNDNSNTSDTNLHDKHPPHEILDLPNGDTQDTSKCNDPDCHSPHIYQSIDKDWILKMTALDSYPKIMDNLDSSQ